MAPSILQSYPQRRVPPPTGRSAGFENDAETFLARLGRALHAQGTPSDRLEGSLEHCAARLGVRAQFFSTPTSLFMGFESAGGQRTQLVRVRPGDVNLGRLADLESLLESVATGELTPRQGIAAVERIEAAPPRFGPVATSLSFGLASSTAALFFGGGAMELALAFVLSGITGAVLATWGRRPAAAPVLETLAALGVTATAFAATRAGWLPSPEVTVLAALIVLVPGLTLTVAINELATRHWVSGSARLAGAGTTFLALGLGVALGRAAIDAPVPAEVVPSGAFPAWAVWVALPIASLAFTVLFQARRRDAPVIVLAGALGFLGSRVGADVFGPELGVFVGALVVGITGNLWARWRSRPASVPQVPGIMLLVPGSIGFRSVTSFLGDDALSGVEGGFRMALMAIALVGGLLMAGALVPTRRSL